MSTDDIYASFPLQPLNLQADSEDNCGRGDSITMKQPDPQGRRDHCTDEKAVVTSGSESKEEGATVTLVPSRAYSSLRHMQDLYDSVADHVTVVPASKDEPDVKAFFKVLRNHRLQGKLVYVLTVVSIVSISHFVLTVRWLLPYFYTAMTVTLLFSRLIMYWKIKYQYFMLDFCYFANIYWLIYIWVLPEREDMFAVGFALANGPLIWALLVFRNSLVFHSLDKVTSLYIHLLPSLMSYVIRWYPDETSQQWYKAFTNSEHEYSLTWLVGVPIVFAILHQVLYIFVVVVVLRPSEDYLNLYRYVMSKENSSLFRLCNIFGPRLRAPMYIFWGVTIMFFMLLFNPVWYSFFPAHCAVLIVFIIIAIFNGATYYIDVFSLEGFDKNKPAPKAKDSEELIQQLSVNGNSSAKAYGTVVICSQTGGAVITAPLPLS